MSDNIAVHREAFWMLVRDKLGAGMSRDVWTTALMPDCVVKVEDARGRFQNVLEWETWQRVKDTPLSRWFAPCVAISPSGTVLVMKRTMPIPAAKYPERMPAFFADFKRANYGFYRGRVVCHDYGTSLLMEEGMTKRTKRVEWWDPE